VATPVYTAPLKGKHKTSQKQLPGSVVIYILPESLPEYAGSSRSRFRKAEKGNVPLGRL
jgi:hypothetical protein